MAKSAVSVRIEDSEIDKLDRLANLNKRDRSFLINEAIKLYLDINDWQLQRIKSGLKQANNQEFASSSQVNKAMSKWRS